MNQSIARYFFIMMIVILVMITASSTSVYAEDMVLGVIPDGVYPVSQTDLSLISEEITVSLTGGEQGQVSCRFDFKNNGAAQRVIMAVPARVNEKATNVTREEFLNVHNFAVFYEKIEGSVPVKTVDAILNQPMKDSSQSPKYSKWHTFPIEFENNEELSVYVMYDVYFPYDNMYNLFTGFRLESGSLWEGSINYGKVIFDLGPYPMYSVTEVWPMEFFRIEDNKLVWENSNFEPSYNLKVTQNDFEYSENRLYILNKNAAKNRSEITRIKEMIALFETSPETIRENCQKYYEEYLAALDESGIKAIYLKSVLELSELSQEELLQENEFLVSSTEIFEEKEENAIDVSIDGDENTVPEEEPAEDNKIMNSTEGAIEVIPEGEHTRILPVIGIGLVLLLCLIIAARFIIKAKH
ncbi:MAG: hypothetical protein WAP58_01805 [Peptococcia bacterium]